MINKVSDPLITNVLAHYDQIFSRTSELYDCSNRDKVITVQYLCDDRIPQSIYEDCQSQWDENCYLAAMQQSIDQTGICTTTDEMMADNTDTSNTSMCACDRSAMSIQEL